MEEEKIQRFPREIQRFPRLKLSRTQSIELRMSQGIIPQGYDKLSKKQRKVARSVASGESVVATCRKYKVRTETYYRWKRCNPLFQPYLNKCAMKSVQDIDAKAARQVSRSMRVIDESL